MSAARTLDTQSEALRAAKPDAVLESAMPGWVGRSREALAASAADWAETLAALADRLHDEGEALRVAAMTFAEMDAGHARTLSGGGDAP